MLGIIYALRFVISTILNAASFTLEYFITLNEYDPGVLFDSLVSRLFDYLERLRPEGDIHIDVMRIVTTIVTFAIVLGSLALLRAVIEWFSDRKRPEAEGLSSSALTVDSAVMRGRVSSGSSATSEVDM